MCKLGRRTASLFAAITNDDISQINEEAVPEIHEKGDKIRSDSFQRQSFVCFT